MVSGAGMLVAVADPGPMDILGLTTNPDEVRAGTILALQCAALILSARAPAELEPYRQLAVGVATAVAPSRRPVSGIGAGRDCAHQDSASASWRT